MFSAIPVWVCAAVTLPFSRRYERKSRVLDVSLTRLRCARARQENQWVLLWNIILEVQDSYIYRGLEVSKEGVGRSKNRRINEGKTRRMTSMINMRTVNKYEVGRSLGKVMAVHNYCSDDIDINMKGRILHLHHNGVCLRLRLASALRPIHYFWS